MRWVKIKSGNPEQIIEISKSLGVSEDFPVPLSNILIQRGYNSIDSVKEFLKPSVLALFDHNLMLGMNESILRITSALNKKEKILIYGDYDVDGTTSVSLLKLFFNDFGFDFPVYSPSRFTEGYGLSYQGIDYASGIGVTLMIVLDCGTKEIEKVRYGLSLGIEMIICDHHKPGSELPPAVALLNPKQPGCLYPFKELSACGIVLKLAEGIEERIKIENIFQSKSEITESVLMRYADLVALSVACDLVPAVGENRIFLHLGIKKLRKNPQPGIEKLKSLSTVIRSWNVEDLVFFLGPRINAAGRKDKAIEAINLFCGNGNIEEFAAELDSKNEWRKETDSQVTAEAFEMIETFPGEKEKASTVLFNEGWHKGVIGIVASRLLEKYYRPTALITKSESDWVGSARSIEGFDLYDALQKCSETLLQFGGHKYAAGFTLKEENLLAFKNKFEIVVRNQLGDSKPEPILEIASELDFSYLTPKFIRLLNYFAPFGPENPEPVFSFGPVEVKEGKILNGGHLKLLLGSGEYSFEAIGFGLAEKWIRESPNFIEIAFQPQIKTWNNNSYIQLKIKDFNSII